MIRRPPRSPLFPYTTLFRSLDPVDQIVARARLLPAGHRVGLLGDDPPAEKTDAVPGWQEDRKSTRLNSSHTVISYAVFCLKKKTESMPKKVSPRTFTESGSP